MSTKKFITGRRRYLINPVISASISLDATKVQQRPDSKIPRFLMLTGIHILVYNIPYWKFYANKEPIVKYCIFRFI